MTAYPGKKARLIYDSLPRQDGLMGPYAARIWKES